MLTHLTEVKKTIHPAGLQFHDNHCTQIHALTNNHTCSSQQLYIYVPKNLVEQKNAQLLLQLFTCQVVRALIMMMLNCQIAIFNNQHNKNEAAMKVLLPKLFSNWVTVDRP